MSGAENFYDVIVVGGGPAGTSAAIHLTRKGARVLLAEQEKFPRPKLCGEFISPECLTHFARLGVAEQMSVAGGAPVARTVFHTRGGRSIEVPSYWLGGGAGAALGLSRAEMDARLLSRARAVGVEVLEEARVTEALIEDGRVRGVALKRGGEMCVFRSLITIDATGRARALTRRVEAAPTDVRKSNSRRRASLVAFKAHLEGARGDGNTCEIYFYRGGYGGLSPVEGGRSNLCFIASAGDVRACGSDAERVMREVVASNRRAAYTLSEARIASRGWLSVPLGEFGRRSLAPIDGLISVGDAASFIDPFTGSGMLMALESGELAAETISRRLSHISEKGVWGEFSREYGARYGARFGARLRLCAWLRRAAFAPRAVAEGAILALGASGPVRRALARATRRHTILDFPFEVRR